MKTFRDIMNLWDSDDDLALDIELKFSRVTKWRVRQKIAPDNWPALLRAAKRRGYHLTLEMLMQCWEDRPKKKVAVRAGRRLQRSSVACRA